MDTWSELSEEREREEREEREHVHEYGPGELSRFAGTWHRKCLRAGCKAISLDVEGGEE